MWGVFGEGKWKGEAEESLLVFSVQFSGKRKRT
jgi:hypothetical protein